MTGSFQPESVERARAWIEERRAGGLPFSVRGCGTRCVWRHQDVLQTGGLKALRFFHPEDMVVGVEAGMACEDLQGMLARRRKALPVNPWFRGATIGGMVAANDFGPDRMNGGGIRDFIIGIEYLNGLGKRVVAGGRVVKNVTGYDLGKMMIGSLGGLGVITAVNFKTKPAAVDPHGLFFRMSGNYWLNWFRDEVYKAHIPIDWVQAVFSEGAWLLGMGISGNGERRRRLIADLQPVFDGQLIVAANGEDPDGCDIFSARNRFGGFLSPIVAALARPYFHLHGIFPTHAFLVRERILEKLVREGFVLVLHPVGADIHILGSEKDLSETTLDRIRRLFSGTGGYLVLEQVPDKLRDIFGFTVPLPSEYLLMKRLKNQLDPQDIFYAPFYEMI